MSPARCRRRSQPRASRCARWCPAIRRCSPRWTSGVTVAHARRPVRRRGAASSRRRAAGLDLFVLDAPHLYARDGDPYRGPDGRDWPDNAFRFAALVARRRAARRRGSCAGYRPDVVHAHDWQAGLAPAYLHYAGAHATGDGDDRAQPRLPGPVSRPICWRSSACRRDAFAVDGVEYYGDDRLPEGRPAVRRSHHHRVADLCGGDPHAGRRHGPGRPAARARRRAVRHSQRHRHDGVGSGARSASRGAVRRRSTRASAPPTRPRCRRSSACAAIRRSCCSASSAG